MLTGRSEYYSTKNGGNIVNTGFIIGSEGVIVIDTGSSKRYGEQMLAAIRRVTPLPIVLTVNTHHHPDHFLGNQAFPRATLAALPEAIAAVGLRPPTLVIVGEVVSLADTLRAVAPAAVTATSYSLAAD